MLDLRMKSRPFSIHKKMKIIDDKGDVAYTVESKVITVHDTTFIRNADDEEVARITRRPITLHETHFIEMKNGTKIEVSQELLHVMKDVIRIEELGWQLRGDFFRHDYELYDEDGEKLAAAHQKWLSIRNEYGLEIYNESLADEIVALYVTLERITADRIVENQDVH